MPQGLKPAEAERVVHLPGCLRIIQGRVQVTDRMDVMNDSRGPKVVVLVLLSVLLVATATVPMGCGCSD